MPLYEYECSQCHRRTEKIQKYSDAELTVCPHCGGPLARTITAPSFQFAGGGWYKDLYSSSAKPAGGDSAASSGGDAASSGTKDAGNSAGSGTPAAPAAAPAAAPSAPVSAPATSKPSGSGGS